MQAPARVPCADVSSLEHPESVMNEEPSELSQLITLQQAAQMLGVSTRTLEREIQRGHFPRPLKIGRFMRRVERAAVIRYIESLRCAQGITS